MVEHLPQGVEGKCYEQHVDSISKVLKPALERLAKDFRGVGERILTIVLNNFGAVDIRVNDAILSGTIKAYIWAQQAPFAYSLSVILTSS